MTKARDVSGSPSVVITSGSFTSVSALTLSNAFSNTYRFYELFIYMGGTTSTDIAVRFRESSTDKTAGYYGGGNYGNYLGTNASYYAANNLGNAWLPPVGNNIPSYTVSRIFRRDATAGVISSQGYDNNNDGGFNHSYINDTMTNFNGINIYPSSGTITGYYILTGIRV